MDFILPQIRGGNNGKPWIDQAVMARYHGEMRLAIFSDLHTEHAPWTPPRMDVDVAICLGDVCSQPGDPHPSLELLDAIRGPAFKLFIPGNHEFAYRHYETALIGMRSQAHDCGITLLHEDEVSIGGFRFLGTPLLSAMCDLPLRRRASAWRHISTTRTEFSGRNTCGDGVWSPRWMAARRRRAGKWLENAMAGGSRDNTVVCTHWAPTAACLDTPFRGIDTASYFHGNVQRLLTGARWWLHGHVHHEVDMDIHGCRVLCHPRGRTDQAYHPLVIDLSQPHRDLART